MSFTSTFLSLLLLTTVDLLLFSTPCSSAILSIDPAEGTTPRVTVKQLKRDLGRHSGQQSSEGNSVLHYNHDFGPPPPEILNQIDDAASASSLPLHPAYAFPSPSSSIQPRGAAGMVDFTGAQTDPETGLLCVIKEDFVDALRKNPVLKCDHRQVRQCHFTYITKFSSQQERVCDENFEKVCQIVFRQQATNETVKKCYKPVEIVCDDGDGGAAPQQYPLPSYAFAGEDNSVGGHGPAFFKGGGGSGDEEEVCETFYESSCTTRYRETHPGKFVGDTRCQKVPRRLCGRPSCRAEEGVEECHDVVLASVSDVPEETCDLNPQQVCRLETRLVPRLEPVEDCRYQPRQVCQVDFSAAEREKRPLKVKLCLREDTVLPPPAGSAYGSPPPSSPVPYYKPVIAPTGVSSSSSPISPSYTPSALSSYNQI